MFAGTRPVSRKASDSSSYPGGQQPATVRALRACEHDNAARLDVEVHTLPNFELQEAWWKRDPASLADEAEQAIVLALPLRSHAGKLLSGALIRMIRRRHSLRHDVD